MTWPGQKVALVSEGLGGKLVIKGICLTIFVKYIDNKVVMCYALYTSSVFFIASHIQMIIVKKKEKHTVVFTLYTGNTHIHSVFNTLEALYLFGA